MIRSLTEAQRQATMAANLELTEAEATKFWPLYREYRNDMAKINDKFVALIKDYARELRSDDRRKSQGVYHRLPRRCRRTVSI